MSYSLSFHQTFKPERVHISSLISFKSLTATKEDISHQFAIPTGKTSGKVEVNLKYAQAAGLLTFYKQKGEYHIKRTNVGDFIFYNDEYLEDELSQLLIHYMFCKKSSPLILWSFLFTDFHKSFKSFSRGEFLKYAGQKLNSSINFSPLIGTYIGDNPLINIKLLNQKDNSNYLFGKFKMIDHYVHWYAFFLLDFLNDIDGSRLDFTLSELQYSGFPEIFGWNSTDVKNLLHMIEKIGTVSLNKQFNNYHIYINKNLPDALSNLYYI